ncbi:uncharacterized protein ACIQIH_015392 [Cyanocitta cristata]
MGQSSMRERNKKKNPKPRHSSITDASNCHHAEQFLWTSAGEQPPSPVTSSCCCSHRCSPNPSCAGPAPGAEVFGAGGVWAPHRPSKPPRKGVTARWKKSGTPLPTEKMAERFQPGTRHLSPRAIQVLRGLEPHQMRRNIFMFLAENNRRRQEQQRQFCRVLPHNTLS